MTTRSHRLFDADLIDVGVYAPLGLARLCVEQVVPALRTEINDLRQQAPAARFIGAMAVQQVRTRVMQAAEQRMNSDCAARTADLRSFVMTKLGMAGGVTTNTGERGATQTSDAEPTSAPVQSSGEVIPEPSAIPGYRDLSAPQVIALLSDLRPEELAEVERYESAHRGRRTILNRIQILKGD